jgi:hypothetical protein
MERGLLEDKCRWKINVETWGGMVRTGFIRLRIGTSGVLLWTE